MERHHVFFNKKNLLRDVVIVAISVGLAYGFIANLLKNQKEAEKAAMSNLTVEEGAEESQIDTTDWVDYKNNAYGFEVKYPKHWDKPTGKFGGGADKWEYRYQFRKGATDDKSVYVGFDVVIYNTAKINEISNTDEFPKAKNTEDKNVCQSLTGYVSESENYPANQISIGEGDDCYNRAYFYNIAREEYIYNIVSVLSTGEEGVFQPETEVVANFPEFVAASSTFDLADITEKAPVAPPVKKRVSAPMPYVFSVDNLGRRVCDKGGKDKPGKSKKGKKHHLDMECCLDPDEDPNPHCYYSPEKYGKYL